MQPGNPHSINHGGFPGFLLCLFKSLYHQSLLPPLLLLPSVPSPFTSSLSFHPFPLLPSLASTSSSSLFFHHFPHLPPLSSSSTTYLFLLLFPLHHTTSNFPSTPMINPAASMINPTPHYLKNNVYPNKKYQSK